MAERPLGIVVHDFSGHPFQAQLARRLAADGHTVRHVSASEYISGKGHVDRLPGDPATLQFDSIELSRPFEKYSPISRIAWELRYGMVWARYARAAPADVVVMCNVPLFAMAAFVVWAGKHRQPWVFWHQDVYSQGMAEEVRRKLPKPLAAAAALAFRKLEAWYARRASHVIAIGDAFTEIYPGWHVPADRVSVIPNWAPLDTIGPVERDNQRTRDVFHDANALRLLYAGTLGRKHNPMLLVRLLDDLVNAGVDAQLTVVTEGPAADDLEQAATQDPTRKLRVLPFQPASDLSMVLSSADVLIGLLEPDATTFSIPSKVLSYLAAGRPIAGLMPADNPASVDIVAAGGFVADPTEDGAQRAADWIAGLVGDAEQRVDLGWRARALAEEKFNLDTIVVQFEGVFEEAIR